MMTTTLRLNVRFEVRYLVVLASALVALVLNAGVASAQGPVWDLRIIGIEAAEQGIAACPDSADRIPVNGMLSIRSDGTREYLHRGEDYQAGFNSFVCMSRQPGQFTRPITDIEICHETCSAGLTIVKDEMGENADLNEGRGDVPVYLAFARGPIDRLPLTDVGFIHDLGDYIPRGCQAEFYRGPRNPNRPDNGEGNRDWLWMPVANVGTPTPLLETPEDGSFRNPQNISRVPWGHIIEACAKHDNALTEQPHENPLYDIIFAEEHLGAFMCPDAAYQRLVPLQMIAARPGFASMAPCFTHMNNVDGGMLPLTDMRLEYYDDDSEWTGLDDECRAWGGRRDLHDVGDNIALCLSTRPLPGNGPRGFVNRIALEFLDSEPGDLPNVCRNTLGHGWWPALLDGRVVDLNPHGTRRAYLCFERSTPSLVTISDTLSCGLVGGVWQDSTCTTVDHFATGESFTLVVPPGTTLKVSAGTKLANKASLLMRGTLQVEGILENVGSLNLDGTVTIHGALRNFGTLVVGGGTVEVAEGGSLGGRGLLLADPASIQNHGGIEVVVSDRSCVSESAGVGSDNPFLVFGTWNALTSTCTMGMYQGVALTLAVPAGVSLHVPSGTTLVNQGILEVRQGGWLGVHGEFRNVGASVNGLRVNNTGTLRMFGTMENYGKTVLANGQMFVGPGAYFGSGRYMFTNSIHLVDHSLLVVEENAMMRHHWGQKMFIDATSTLRILGTLFNEDTIYNRGRIETGFSSGVIQMWDAWDTVIVVEGGGTLNDFGAGQYHGTIGTTSTPLSGATCPTIGGAWTAATSTCLLPPSVHSIANRYIRIPSGVTLHNLGVLNLSGGLIVDGIIVNHNAIEVGVTGDGFISIGAGGAVRNFGSVRFGGGSSRLDNAGQFLNAAGSVLAVFTSAGNSSIIDNYGTIDNDASFDNFGSIRNRCDGRFDNGAGAIFVGAAPETLACSASPLEPMIVTVSSSPNPSAIGQAVTLTAAVNPADAQGTVTFFDGGSSLGQVNVNNGFAALTTTAIGAGFRSLTARYNGDSQHAATTSLPRSHSVTQAGSNPVAVAVADFDGDGKNDIAVVNNGSATVTVSRGLGDGSFQTQSSPAVGASPVNIAVGDVNGDNRKDLVVAANNGLSLLFGNGDGTFQASQTLSTNGSSRGVVIADFNNDSKADLAATSSFSGVVVMMGDGLGAFGAPAAFPAGSGARAVAAGLINTDSHVDLLVTNDVSGTVSLLAGNGAGAFAAPLTFSGYHRPTAIVARDFNADGRLDIAVADSVTFGTGQGLSVRYNTGNLTVFGSPQLYSTGAGTVDVAAVDFNDDRRPDLITADFDANALSVYLNTGSAFAAASGLTVGAGPNGLGVGDVNDDLLSDILSTNFTDNSISVALGTSTNPDLVMSASHSANFQPYSAGWKYTLTVSNVGYGPTSGTTTVTPLVPAGLTATALAGNGWTCTMSPLGCQRNDALAANTAIAPITLTVSTGEDTGTVVLSASVHVTGLEVTTSNNSTTDVTHFATTATLSMTSDPNPSQPGAAVTLRATVSPSSKAGVILFYDGSTMLGTAALANGVATFTTPSLSSGSHGLSALLNDSAQLVVTGVTHVVYSQLLASTPPTVVIEATNSQGAVVSDTRLGGPAVTGGVAPVTVTRAPAVNQFPIGTTTVVWMVADASGQSQVREQQVFVIDTTAPMLTVPANMTIEAAPGSPSAMAIFAATATDLVDGFVMPACAPATGSSFAIGTTTVSCSATDARGNTSTGSFSVTVNAALVSIGAPQTVTIEATGGNGAAIDHATLGSPIATGGSSALTISRAPAGNQFALGETIVTWTASDESGQTTSATQIVIVRDTTAPSLTLPSNIAIDIEAGQTAAAVNFAATAADLADASPAINCSPVSGSSFPIGATTVSCTATDASGNPATGLFTVTVTATPQPEPEPEPQPQPKPKKPVITAPKQVKVEATGPNGAIATFEATALDAVDGAIPVLCSHVSGAVFPVGKTAVLCSAINSRGKTDAATINVIVRDTVEPEIVSVTPSLTSLPNGGGMVPVTLTVDVRDLVDQAPTCQVTRVTSNIKDADLNGVPDWQITGPLGVSLEAATTKNKTRNYKIVVKCSDASGNAAVEHAAVVVSK